MEKEIKWEGEKWWRINKFSEKSEYIDYLFKVYR